MVSKNQFSFCHFTDYLSIKDLQAVLNELYDARVKWFNFALELKICPNDLAAIRMRHRDDPDECFKDSLSTWLNKGDPTPTWYALVNALRSPTVGFHQLSEQVQQKKMLSANASQAMLLCTYTPQPIPQHQKDFTSGHFQCPCGNCDLLTYLDNGCPKSTSRSYPYLPLPEISENDREDLFQKLSDDTTHIIQCFADLMSNTSKSLKSRQVTITELVKVALDLGAYKSGKNPVPLLSHDRAELMDATSIDGVFIVLQKHVSFFNHEVLGHIVTHLGDDNDRRKFEKYCFQFKHYCKRKVFEVPPNVFNSYGAEESNRKFFVVIGTEALFDTLSDVKAGQRKIASLLGLRASAVQLKQIDEGCVILIFSIPKIISDIFPLEPTACANLKACGFTVIVPSAPSYTTHLESQVPGQKLISVSLFMLMSENSEQIHTFAFIL